MQFARLPSYHTRGETKRATGQIAREMSRPPHRLERPLHVDAHHLPAPAGHVIRVVEGLGVAQGRERDLVDRGVVESVAVEQDLRFVAADGRRSDGVQDDVGTGGAV
jgi:hypothetical protein